MNFVLGRSVFWIFEGQTLAHGILPMPTRNTVEVTLLFVSEIAALNSLKDAKQGNKEGT